MRIHTLLLTTLVAAGIAGGAYPCGDNAVYRVGKGLVYRVYTAPLPGHVLVYGHTDAAKEIALQLLRSGHEVRFVDSDQELQSELETGAYDVVIAPYGDHAVVEGTARTARPATLLPVTETRDEEKRARQDYQHVLQARKDDIKQYLIAIHQTLRNRG